MSDIYGDIYADLASDIVRGDIAAAVERLQAHGVARLDDGLFLDCIARGMDEVGRRYETGEYFIPEMLASSRVVKALFAAYTAVRPRPPATSGLSAAIGTVKGDVHDIGKEIIVNSLEGLGIHVIDLGTNVDAARFVAAVAGGARLLMISAFTTVTRRYVRVVLDELAAAGLLGRAQVLVGGAAANPEFCAAIGARYFRDARAVVEFVRTTLLGQGACGAARPPRLARIAGRPRPGG